MKRVLRNKVTHTNARAAQTMNIFKKKRTPKQVGENLGDAAQAFVTKRSDDTAATLAKRISESLSLVYGTSATPARIEDSAILSTALVESDAMLSLLPTLSAMPFEARKEYSELFCFLTTNDLSGFATTYLMARKTWVLSTLVMSYQDSDVALMCGEMLRACLKFEDLSREMLFSKDMALLDKFFQQYLVDSLFDVSSDAFATFRTALTSCRDLVSQFLSEKFELFFDRYNALLTSESYLTQRQALKLLSQILLDRHNFRSMMRYIGDKNNLRIVMNLLRVDDMGIRHETFDVFKVFVANPNRTPEVNNILFKNRDKIVAYLQGFKPERDVEAIVEEKNLLVNSMLALKFAEPTPPPPVANADEGAAHVADVAPVAAPTVAAPVAAPTVAAPVAAPTVAAPVAAPTVAAPVAAPAVATPAVPLAAPAPAPVAAAAPPASNAPVVPPPTVAAGSTVDADVVSPDVSAARSAATPAAPSVAAPPEVVVAAAAPQVDPVGSTPST